MNKNLENPTKVERGIAMLSMGVAYSGSENMLDEKVGIEAINSVNCTVKTRRYYLVVAR